MPPHLVIEPPQATFHLYEGDAFVSFNIENTGDSTLVVTSCSFTTADPALKLGGGGGFTVLPGHKHVVTVTKIGLAPTKDKITIHTKDGESRTIGIVAAAGKGLPVCFGPKTLVLLADGTARAICDLAVGDTLRTVSELDHLTARPAMTSATVEAVMSHDNGGDMVELDGILVTADHRWAAHDAVEPRFIATRDLTATPLELLACSGGEIAWHGVPRMAAHEALPTVWNLTTSARTYCVAARSTGPFFVVHNTKKVPKGDGAAIFIDGNPA